MTTLNRRIISAAHLRRLLNGETDEYYRLAAEPVCTGLRDGSIGYDVPIQAGDGTCWLACIEIDPGLDTDSIDVTPADWPGYGEVTLWSAEPVACIRYRIREGA